MTTKLERFGLGLILAPVLPMAGLMGFWWSAYALLPEAWIPFATIAGLLAGILAALQMVAVFQYPEQIHLLFGPVVKLGCQAHLFFRGSLAICRL